MCQQVYGVPLIKLHESCAEILNYFNEDKGTELSKYVSDTRVVCANIAWCFVDKERFMYYYNLSDFWKVILLSAARPFCLNYGVMDVQSPIDEFMVEVRRYLREVIGTRIIWKNPQRLSSRLDYNTVIMMLVQLYYEVTEESVVKDGRE